MHLPVPPRTRINTTLDGLNNPRRRQVRSAVKNRSTPRNTHTTHSTAQYSTGDGSAPERGERPVRIHHPRPHNSAATPSPPADSRRTPDSRSAMTPSEIRSPFPDSAGVTFPSQRIRPGRGSSPSIPHSRTLVWSCPSVISYEVIPGTSQGSAGRHPRQRPPGHGIGYRYSEVRLPMVVLSASSSASTPVAAQIWLRLLSDSTSSTPAAVSRPSAR